ncbi:MAG: hypothetical protein KGI69_02045 [Patescibacteria group bacterium]|nr:hypothetical protein [Patescibacteria group bacterium]
MSLEGFPQPNEEKPLDRGSEPVAGHAGKPGTGIGRWLKSRAALSGAIGLGYLSGLHGAASEGHESSMKPRQATEHAVEQPGKGPAEAMFEVLDDSDGFTWGVEYVPKEHEGRGILAERFVKIDKRTKASVVVGEYDNVIDAEKGISSTPDVPEKVRAAVAADYRAVMTERAFQDSGLVDRRDGRDAAGVADHVEERTFKGYGIDVRNKVKVDKDGKPVGILSTEPRIKP